MGLVDVPITDSNHEWQGYIPFDRLPSTLDPANGIIATANSRITPDNYPYGVSDESADPYRNERNWKWRAAKDHHARRHAHAATDALEVDQDWPSASLRHRSRRQHRSPLAEAADLMRTWDGVLTIDSTAAAIVESAKSAFWPMLLKPKIGDDWLLYHWA